MAIFPLDDITRTWTLEVWKRLEQESVISRTSACIFFHASQLSTKRICVAGLFSSDGLWIARIFLNCRRTELSSFPQVSG